MNLVFGSKEMLTVIMHVCEDFRFGQSVQLSSTQNFDLTRELLGFRIHAANVIVGCNVFVGS